MTRKQIDKLSTKEERKSRGNERELRLERRK
jgi:hypothetical protein